MHIAEGYLSPLQCALWYAASAPFVIHGAKAVIETAKKSPEHKLLLAAAGAFTFVLSAIKLPSVTGSSSHPTGTGAGAILFRPPVMAFLGTVVLLFQSLLLAHGGLTTLGANVFSMAIAGPWVGYAIWRLVRKAGGPAWLGVFCAMAIANLTTYSVTSLQLAIAHPDPSSGFGGALVKFLTVFAVTQIPLSIAEGLLGVLLFGFFSRIARSDLVRLGVLSDHSNTSRKADHVAA